jgi:hypothetical protein
LEGEKPNISFPPLPKFGAPHSAFKTATKQQQQKKKKRKMVRFFTERKTKATRMGVARRFPTFAHRSQNGGADSPREDFARYY